jgi:hypothetical protein
MVSERQSHTPSDEFEPEFLKILAGAESLGHHGNSSVERT